MKCLTVVWAVAVLLCIAGQPFTLGFYTDDWPQYASAVHVGAPFSKALLRHAYLIDPSRPGLAPFRFLSSSLFGDRVLLWHIGLLFANCLVALILILLIGLLSGENLRTKGAPIWIGLCWLLLPWNASAQFWPTFLPNVLTLAAFGLLCAILMRGWSRHKHHALLAGVIYLWVCLGYEAFYFQWAALAVFGLVLSRFGRARLRDVAYSTSALIVGQICAVVCHVYSERFVTAGFVERPIISDWPRVLLGDLLTTIPSMFRSFGQARVPFAAVALCLGAVWLAGYYKSLRPLELRKATRASVTLAACCLVGGVLSILAFALGGRGIQATGTETRTLLIFNFWLVVAVGICVSALLERADRLTRVVMLVLLGCLGITLAVGHVLRLTDWATAWRLQTKILAEAPVGDLRETPAEAKILLINRVSVNGAPIFEAPWDLNAAMPWKHPFLEGREFLVYQPQDGVLIWDGQKLTYQGDGHSETASDLYVWRPAQRSFTQAREPFRVLPSLMVEEMR